MNAVFSELEVAVGLISCPPPLPWLLGDAAIDSEVYFALTDTPMGNKTMCVFLRGPGTLPCQAG